MDRERYVSAETAELLKQKGFDWDCKMWYYINTNGTPIQIDKKFPFSNDENTIPCPTQQMVVDWLLEKHHLFVQIEFASCEEDWYCADVIPTDDRYIPENSSFEYEHSSIYEAYEYGFKFCLTNVIE